MSELNLDRARKLILRARVGRAASFRFRFFSGGNPYPINSFGFEWFLKEHKDSPDKVIKMSVGSGLTIEGTSLNELVIPIVTANANLLKPRTYHSELLETTKLQSWINGPFICYNGEFDASNGEKADLVINLGELVVNVDITVAGFDLTNLSEAQLKQLATALAPHFL